MSEDKIYKDGDIVWVKLGNSWWPGEVIGDEKRLPDDVHQFKKRPYCVVKFFQEDAYEYPKNAKQVHPFQCSKKDEFIKKGLALYNAKKAFMEKFPDDVKHAEKLTKLTTNITTTRIMNYRSGGLVKEMWGPGLSTPFDCENFHMAPTNNSGSGSHNYHATSRRDSVTTILNITQGRSSIGATTLTSPTKSATSTRTLSTSSSASVTPNTPSSSSQYRCNMCDFTTMRQNVFIMHRKSHSSSGSNSVSTKPLTSLMRSSISSINSFMQRDPLDVAPKSVEESVFSSTSTPLTSKRIDKSRIVNVDEEKNVELAATELITSTRSRKKASASPSPKVVTSKRTLRNSRATSQLASPTIIDSTVAAVEIEKTEAAIVTSKIDRTDITLADDDDAAISQTQQTGTISPTDSKNSEQIRQRLLADWSDEEKDENHEDTAPTTSRKNKSSNTLQLPSLSSNVSLAIKRRSPTIVPMKTLEGAGQTLVVAASTQSSVVQEIIARTAQRIRNIPKKDRLRDFTNISSSDEQPKASEALTGKPTTLTSDALRVTESEANSCSTNAPSATLSCFDFQEDEEEPENNVLKSIANYKKKYFSPDKDKSCQLSSANNEHIQSIKEQHDKELSAEIDSLLEQTTVVTQTIKEDTAGSVSVKGLPIKERGKRIFKSRNRTRIDDDDGGPTVEVANKPIEALDSDVASVEEIQQETIVSAVISPSISERKTRGTSKRTRGKSDSKDSKQAPSPVNGNAERIQTPENASVELPSVIENVHPVGGMVYVSQSSRRKPYNHRIMRQLIEEEETSIPFIRHSPVEIYSCDSSLDNGTHVIRGRRSKTTTPNSLTAGREETVNGGGGGSRASSRSMNAAPLTPTDETSSLGVSDAGAEFGSPASSLDEERLLTPVHDTDNQHANEFEPISDSRSYHEMSTESNDELEEDDEIESPQHEALSGNELEDHELKKGTKRLKSPKKKLNAKEQQQQEADTSTVLNKAVEKRKSRAGTASPAANDLPKRLTRGALQQKSKEASEEAQELENSTPPTRARSTRGSPANIELKQKPTEKRSTPTRASSRHAAATDTATGLITSTSKSIGEKVESVEHDAVDNLSNTVDNVASEKKVPSTERVTVDSPTKKSDVPKASTMEQSQQRKLKARRSKTPAIENEAEKLSTNTEAHIKPIQEILPNTNKCEPSREIQEIADNFGTKSKERNRELEKNTAVPESSKFDDQKESLQKSNSSVVTISEAAVTANLVEPQIEDKKKAQIIDTSSQQASHIDKPAQTRKRSSPSNEATIELNPREKPSRTPSLLSLVKKSSRTDSSHSRDTKSSASDSKPIPSAQQFPLIDSPHNPDSKSLHSDSAPIPDQKPSRIGSPHTPNKKLSRVDSPHNPSKNITRTESPHSPDKKLARTESPHSPDKKHFRTESPHSTDKKLSRTESPHSPEKKLCRTERPHSPDKKLSITDSPHSLPKKHSRWDSPDKKSPRTESHSPDKKVSRWDSPRSSDKKPTRPESPQSLAKKYTRWDSPLHAENNKKLEDSKSTTKSVTKAEAGEVNKATTEHLTREKATNKDLLLEKDGKNTKSQLRNSPVATKVDGKETANVTELNPKLLTKHIPQTEAPIVDNVSTPMKTSASSASIITSPTMEKVRINVDVANPLSTQIANILAASGNSIQNQQLSSRNKSPKSNTSSPLKRKHSLEEANVVATTEADGDAVVAHMQSLCPQVKITRKERIITPTAESIITSSKKAATTQNISGGPYDISQMPIVLSNEQISAPKKSPRNSVSSGTSVLSASNLWQTDLLQPPTTSTSLMPATDSQAMPLLESHGQKYDMFNATSSSSEQAQVISSPTPSTSNEGNQTTTGGRHSGSSQSPSSQKSPAAATGGRKQAGNTVTLPSSITVKQHQHKFAEALALADSVLASSTRPTKRRSSQTTPTSTANASNANSNRRLNSAPALDVRSTPPAKIPKIPADAELSKSSPIKVQPEGSPLGKTWSQSQRQAPRQKKLDSPSEIIVESSVEETTASSVAPSSPTKIENTEESENVTDVEQLNSTAKITAVPIQPIPGYAEPFLLCMLVDNMYKPINNIPHYLNTDLNQLVPVPPEAYKGMLPELAVDQPPASSTESEATTESFTMSDSTLDQQSNQMNDSNQQQQMHLAVDKSQPLLATRELGESSIYSDGSTTEEAGFKLVLQSDDSALVDSAAAVDQDVHDSAVENTNDNAIVLNLENQQIILDAATFEQLLANPDANTQLVTDDGTEFVLTREVLTALKAQHDGQNVDLLAIPSEQQQLQEQLMVPGGISEAGSSTDLLSVALSNSEFYGNDVLQIETTLGAGAGAAGLQLLASDGSIVFQAPPLPQAHLTPPITAHTSETNAVLNQTPIMSTLETPSTAVIGGKVGIETPTAAVVSDVECDAPGMRPNLDDSLAVIGVSTQSSTVPTSLELPITITNPAIAPKVTMAQSAHGADLVQFQPHRSVATAAVASTAANVAHIFDDPIEGIN